MELARPRNVTPAEHLDAGYTGKPTEVSAVPQQATVLVFWAQKSRIPRARRALLFS